MKKNLPRVFQNKIDKQLNNNKHIYCDFTNERSDTKGVTIDELFKQNQIYRKSVKITTKDGVIIKKIIGRSIEHLITLENELIKIEDILKIEEI